MTSPTPRQPLDYEPPRPGSPRNVSPAAISIALGAISMFWIVLAWLSPYRSVPDVVRWMFIAGTLPSAVVGGLLALFSVRGTWRVLAASSNLIALMLALVLALKLLVY